MAGESGSTSLDREDAVAYGVEGLIQAVDSFDPNRGTTFSSYAVRRIRGSVLDAIRRMDLLPRSIRRSAREIDKASLEMAAMLGRWPTLRELAMRLSLPVDQVREVLGHTSSRILSLERMMGDRPGDGSPPWEASDRTEFSDPAVAADHRAMLKILDQAIAGLPTRDRRIIELRYGRGLPFHEIGSIMRLSESRVCQLHKRILIGLRKNLFRETDIAA
jgi:RNA polymerase sigma factor for flagellar operon FliA